MPVPYRKTLCIPRRYRFVLTTDPSVPDQQAAHQLLALILATSCGCLVVCKSYASYSMWRDKLQSSGCGALQRVSITSACSILFLCF